MPLIRSASFRSFALVCFGALALAGCGRGAETVAADAAGGERMVAPVLTEADARDIHSYARPEIARVTHVALDLAADFQARTMGGTATLDIQAAEGAGEVVLDTKGLAIARVTNAEGQPLQYALGAADPNLGRPLTVRLNGADRIVVTYQSAPGAEALQWLTPAQTAGKRHPFLFSQGQAILNRTWIPTQDSPGIRQTWEARITVPEPLKVVMSGENRMPQGEEAGEGRRAYLFRMDKPVAPYLIALAVGDLAFQSLGPRSGVYAEPPMLKAAAAELADTERMIDAAEALYGPYRWGRYDMIVLPPAFPFGGMENPMLTFLTPTMIAGDKSLTSLIAHELAHSWSGNLVTNANWADFWINEGFTVYFEGRIMEALYGEKRANQLRALGWSDLQRTIADNGGPTDPRTALHLDLAGQNPDDGMTDIAYEKGAAFLRTIEQAVGRERFDAYLRSYFDRHAFQPMTARRFLDDITRHLLGGDQELADRLMLRQWVYEPGIPANVAPVPANAFAEVDRATQAFLAGGPIGAVPYGRWSTAERLRFLNALPREMPAERLAALDRALNLTAATNSETLFAWLQLALANRYEPALPAAERFLTGMGRRKFVEPLFRTLMEGGAWGQQNARRIYQAARPGYHAVTRDTIDALIAPSA